MFSNSPPTFAYCKGLGVGVPQGLGLGSAQIRVRVGLGPPPVPPVRPSVRHSRPPFRSALIL